MPIASTKNHIFNNFWSNVSAITIAPTADPADVAAIARAHAAILTPTKA